MAQKQIIISVAPDGEIHIDAVGFKGQGCEKAVAAIQAAMGAKGGKSGRKPEYWNTQGQSVTQGH